MPTTFDHHFKIYAAIYFADIASYHWFRAMGIVESALDPNAISPAGAVGIMQLMPGTSAQVARELWLPDTPLDPQRNILMGIHYARKMWNIFAKEEGLERLLFMFAAYNAGAKNIIKAQKYAARPDQWQDVAAALPKITGHHAKETVAYVERIVATRQQMLI